MVSQVLVLFGWHQCLKVQNFKRGVVILNHEKNGLATWIPIGVGVGLIVGLVLDKLMLGLGLGCSVGVCIGSYIDSVDDD